METTENNQANLFADQKSAAGGPVLRMRECTQCGQSYAFKRADSKYCSLKCKNAARDRGAVFGNTDPGSAVPSVTPAVAAVMPSPAPQSMISPALFKDQPIHVQVAFDMLKERNEEWRQKVCELQAENKKLIEERDGLKAQVTEKQHALSGLEDARPSLAERILGSIPAPWIEALSGPLQAIASKMVSGGASPMAGVNGQLDAAAKQYLEEISTWFASLPGELQGKVYEVLLGVAQQKDAAGISEVLTRITTLIHHDNPFQNSAPGQQQHYAPSMFATANGVH
jgi:hypothetical protein